jgi:hypothetical protein
LVNGETVIFAINLRMATLSVLPSTGTCNAKKGITEIILKVGVLREKNWVTGKKIAHRHL